MTGRRGLAAVMAFLGAMVAGCGVPEDAQPRAFEIGRFVSDVEVADLEGRDPSDTLGTESVSIWLIRGAELVERTRTVADVAVPDLVTQLLVGPTDAELDAGFRSAISQGARLRQVRFDDDETVTIDIQTPFTDTRVTYELISAIGQLVFTATSIPGVKAVRLALDGEIIPALTEAGEPSRDPVDRADYDSLLGAEEAE